MAYSFDKIKHIIDEIYNETLDIDSGNVANYIPQLAEVNPELYGISFCSVQGETYNIGDHTQDFCLQSCSKPLNYCLARMNSDKVHNHVGYEPSGRSFNSHVLNPDGLPHNPMINAGAIMTTSLISPTEEPSKRFEKVHKFYIDLCGGIDYVGFDNTVYLSEKHHADRNTSLAYFMRENKAFAGDPTKNDIETYLDLYFQCCSVLINSQIGAVISSTLANGGVCPISNKSVINKDIVRDCLSLMYQCGMYDFSGQFAFKIGLPAKSGVSGCLLLVVPNVGGFCIWSPRLDEMGNSVRGIEFCKKFVSKTAFQFHIFHSVTHSECQSIIPEDNTVKLQRLINASSQGNLDYVKELKGLIDYNSVDYDGRSALHLAAAEGHYDIVEYLIEEGVDTSLKDRWGNTAYHEANKMRTAIVPSEQKEPYNLICSKLETN